MQDTGMQVTPETTITQTLEAGTPGPSISGDNQRTEANEVRHINIII